MECILYYLNKVIKHEDFNTCFIYNDFLFITEVLLHFVKIHNHQRHDKVPQNFVQKLFSPLLEE